MWSSARPTMSFNMPKNSTFTRTIVIVTDGPERSGFQGLGFGNWGWGGDVLRSAQRVGPRSYEQVDTDGASSQGGNVFMSRYPPQALTGSCRSLIRPLPSSLLAVLLR